MAWLEVIWKYWIGWSAASTYCTPGWVRSASICAFVPLAPTTSIRANVTLLAIAVEETARLASARVAPWTRTVVVPLRVPICWLR